ncbi:MAG: hypothetical protein UW88_C0010G0009 [Candidatus Collierbacteria bacterium GW2011_GWD2_45_10]|nr:MAG: hypothetical protein UW88_C0010G0009 [Candidatus Collierbacteria bacterium GW2011_GWD2_45_10]
MFPETVKVLSKVVAPCKVSVPGVVVEPMVFTDEAPVPKVLLPAEVMLPEIWASPTRSNSYPAVMAAVSPIRSPVTTFQAAPPVRRLLRVEITSVPSLSLMPV